MGVPYFVVGSLQAEPHPCPCPGQFKGFIQEILNKTYTKAEKLLMP
jgi:hypothetical protein